jgi:hypothetical protein
MRWEGCWKVKVKSKKAKVKEAILMSATSREALREFFDSSPQGGEMFIAGVFSRL